MNSGETRDPIPMDPDKSVDRPSGHRNSTVRSTPPTPSAGSNAAHYQGY